MKPTQCLFSPAAALRRVFIQNALATQSSRQLVLPRLLLPAVVTPRLQHPLSTQAALRNKYATKPETSGSGFEKLRDQHIQDVYPLVHFRDEATGKLSEPTPPSQIWRKLSRREQALVVIALPSEKGPQYPICRIIDRIAEREQREALRAKQKQQDKLRNADKELEINWAIAPHDLNLKLNQLRKFLDKGFTVQLNLLQKSKRGKRSATVDEVKALMDKLNQEIQNIPGAKEIKRTGTVGKSFTVIVQGTKGAVTAAESAAAGVANPVVADAGSSEDKP